MRIFARKAYSFSRKEVINGQTAEVETFQVKPGVFTEAPEWIKNDIMFKWAKEDGDLEVVLSANDDIGITSQPINLTAKRTKAAIQAEKELMESIAEAATQAIEQAETIDVEAEEITEAPIEEAPVEEKPASTKK